MEIILNRRWEKANSNLMSFLDEIIPPEPTLYPKKQKLMMSYLPPTCNLIVTPVLGTFTESNSGYFALVQARLKKKSETENRNRLGRLADRPLPPVLGMVLIYCWSSWRAWMGITKMLNLQPWEMKASIPILWNQKGPTTYQGLSLDI